jgi:lipopolysaccharide transport system permease protein
MTSVNLGTCTRIAAEPAGHTHLRPGVRAINLHELWRYRDLLWFLALRDVQVRYKQSVLGAAWAIIQPVVMMVVFSVVFGRMMGVGDRIDVPYPIFAYAGLLPWTFFAGSVVAASNSLVANAGMLRKIYFPRIMLPLAAMGAPMVDFAIAFVVLIGLMVWYGIALNLSLLLLPVIIGSIIIAALGVGIGMAAVTVTYRDFRHIVPYTVQVWLFVTPVIYPVEIASDYQWLVNLNPMAGPISALRAAVLGQPIDLAGWLVSFGVACGMLAMGLRQFTRREHAFADVV